MPSSTHLKPLDQLPRGQAARIAEFVDDESGLVTKLREIGFAESDEVELMHTGPLGGKPLCFRLNRTMIALRADEARAILVNAQS